MSNRLHKPPPTDRAGDIASASPPSEPSAASGQSSLSPPEPPPSAHVQPVSSAVPVAGPSTQQPEPIQSGRLIPPQSGDQRTLLRPAIGRARRPSVRIRRQLPVQLTPVPLQQLQPPPANIPPPPRTNEDQIEANRRRSNSEPQRPPWLPTGPQDGALLTKSNTGTGLPPLREEPSGPEQYGLAQTLAVPPAPEGGRLRRASNATLSLFGLGGTGSVRDDNSSIQPNVGNQHEEFDSHMVDFLDAVDPEVATLSTLTNVQNSLFIPNLGPLINRRPTYTLSRPSTRIGRPPPPPPPPPPPVAEPEVPEAEEEEGQEGKEEDEPLAEGKPGDIRPEFQRLATITSVMSESRYAVLPHGTKLAGWTSEEKTELNDHVRHMMHSRRSAFKRGLRGFGKYARRPLGFFVTLYATLITLFGLAWVLFLIGWVNLGSRRLYIINVIDNVLVALFAIMGDGLAPFRAVDTYHMIYIAHYHLLTWRLRKEQHLPKLENKNDLPVKQQGDVDAEDVLEEGFAGESSEDKEKEFNEYGVEMSDRKRTEYSVLTPAQQKKLQHHQTKFANSHTFYRPHETETHFAFPLRLLIVIVTLLDCHSLLQIALGTCTWSISYHVRPFALTTVILCCSITVNITAGVLISVGDHKTRKKDVLERMFRQELTGDAIKKMDKRRAKERKRNESLDTLTQPRKSKTGELNDDGGVPIIRVQTPGSSRTLSRQ